MRPRAQKAFEKRMTGIEQHLDWTLRLATAHKGTGRRYLPKGVPPWECRGGVDTHWYRDPESVVATAAEKFAGEDDAWRPQWAARRRQAMKMADVNDGFGATDKPLETEAD